MRLMGLLVCHQQFGYRKWFPGFPVSLYVELFADFSGFDGSPPSDGFVGLVVSQCFLGCAGLHYALQVWMLLTVQLARIVWCWSFNLVDFFLFFMGLSC